ncbi:MAG: hypothetical protein P1P65_03240 [Treponema sp.]
MLPFYFLAVTTNLIMGLILVVTSKNKEEYNVKYSFLQDPTFLLVLLIFSGIAAVFKLLSPIGGGYIILGDFIPALSGSAGSILFFERWSKAAGNEASLPPFFGRLPDFEQMIGFFCLGAGVLHLFFSESLFL